MLLSPEVKIKDLRIRNGPTFVNLGCTGLKCVGSGLFGNREVIEEACVSAPARLVLSHVWGLLRFSSIFHQMETHAPGNASREDPPCKHRKGLRIRTSQTVLRKRQG